MWTDENECLQLVLRSRWHSLTIAFTHIKSHIIRQIVQHESNWSGVSSCFVFFILHTTSHCWVQVNATLGKNVLVWFSQFGRFITSTQQRHSCWREIWAKGCSQSETTAAPHLPVWPCRTGRHVLSLDKVGRHVRQTSSFKADWEIQFLNIRLNTGTSSTNSLIESLNIQVDHKMVIALHDFKFI